MRLLLICLLLVSCSNLEEGKDSNRFHIQAEQESGFFIEKLKKEIPISIYGLGGSFYGEQIHYVSIALFLPGEVDLEMARSIICQLSINWIEWMNQNEFLKGYTEKGVFDFSHVDLSVSFFHLGEFDSEHIAIVSANHRGVFYTQHLSPEREYVDVHEETWEEAVELAKDLGGIWPTAVMPNSEAKNGEEEPNN